METKNMLYIVTEYAPQGEIFGKMKTVSLVFARAYYYIHILVHLKPVSHVVFYLKYNYKNIKSFRTHR